MPFNKSTKILPYLITLFSVSTLGGILWAYIAIKLYFETGAMAILIGFLAGLTTSIFFTKDRPFFYTFFTLLFCLYGIYLGKYLSYAHLYVDGTLVNPEASLRLVLSLLSGITLDKIGSFKGFLSENFSFFDLVWLTIGGLTALLNINVSKIRQRKLWLHRFLKKFQKGN